MLFVLLIATSTCFLGKYNCLEDEFNPKQSNICTPDHQEDLTTSRMMRKFPQKGGRMNGPADELKIDTESDSSSANVDETLGEKKRKKGPSQKIRSLPHNVAQAVDEEAFFGNDTKNYVTGRRRVAAMRSNGRSKTGSKRHKGNRSSVRPDYTDDTADTVDPNSDYQENESGRPDYNDPEEENSGTQNLDDGFGDEGLYEGENAHQNMNNAHDCSQNGRRHQRNASSGNGSRGSARSDGDGSSCGKLPDLEDFDPENFDWSPIVRKVVVPAQPRKICMLKIVPVPVTKDGKLWKPNSE